MKPYAFFLDIDGTLASHGRVPEENVCAIKEAQRCGHFVFINTGRSFSYISDEIKFSAPYDGFVCALGADIRFRGEQIFSQTISFDIIKGVTDIFLKHPEQFLILEGEDFLYYTGESYIPKGALRITSPEDWDTKYLDAKISKMTHATMQEGPLTMFADKIVPYVHPTYTEYAQKGLSKASGMHMVAEKLSIPYARCVAIGDSLNDMEMLKAAGISVVMENGTDEVKAIADFITGDAEHAGVAQAIRTIIHS